MDTTVTGTETPTPRVPAPASKPHQLSAKTVYSLVQVTHTRRVAVYSVRKVYNTHLKNTDVAFEEIPEPLMAAAIADLRAKLPDVFEQCEGDWFGAWALHNRHRGRFRTGKKRGEELHGDGEREGEEEK